MENEGQNQENQQSENTQGQNQSQSENHLAQGQDGSPPSWIPEELKTQKTLHKFKEPNAVFKSYVELEKKINAKGVILPNEKSTPEEWNSYYKTIGRPDSPDGYKLNNEGVTVDENLQKAAVTMFHEAGLNNKQADILNSKWNALQKELADSQAKQVEQMQQKVTAEFKKEWGNNFDINLKKADDAGHRVFGKGFMDALLATGLNNSPDVIKGLHKLSTVIGEHSFTTGNSNRATQPSITFEKLLSMKSDPRYWDSGRRDPAFVKEVEAANRAYAESKGA